MLCSLLGSQLTFALGDEFLVLLAYSGVKEDHVDVYGQHALDVAHWRHEVDLN